MTIDQPAPPRLPACPKCHSAETIKTLEHFTEQLLFCPACEHSWSTFLKSKRQTQPLE